MQDYSAHDCDVTLALGSPALDVEICKVYAKAVGIVAGTLNQNLSDAVTEGSASYLGVQPPELTLLLGKTREAAKNLEANGAALGDCTGAECAAGSVDFGLSMSQMTSALSGWKPYGA
jgi:hypothetical protein